MTSGSVPNADAPESESSTTPTDGPPSEPVITVTEGNVTLDVETLRSSLLEMWRAGWNSSRMMTGMPTAPDLQLEIQLNTETRQCNVIPMVKL